MREPTGSAKDLIEGFIGRLRCQEGVGRTHTHRQREGRAKGGGDSVGDGVLQEVGGSLAPISGGSAARVGQGQHSATEFTDAEGLGGETSQEVVFKRGLAGRLSCCHSLPFYSVAANYELRFLGAWS